MHPADPRVAAPAVTVAVLLAALVALLALALLLAPAAGAAPRLHPPAEAAASSSGEEAQIRAYWTPERMRSTPPLLASGRVKHVGRGRYRLIDGVENRAQKNRRSRASNLVGTVLAADD